MATTLGESITSGMEYLLERVEAERKVRNVWHWLPDDVIEFTIEMSSETTVAVADHDAPYPPIGRFRSLLQDGAVSVPRGRYRLALRACSYSSFVRSPTKW